MKKLVGILIILVALIIGLLYFLPYFKEAEEVQGTVERNYKLVEKTVTENKTPPEVKPYPVEHGDKVAWLSIEACEIDYPVYENNNRQAKYKGVEEDFYLHHNEEGEEAVRGCIYTNNYEGSPIMIYGHHMSDGSMFGRLSGVVPGIEVKLLDLTMSDFKYHYYDVIVSENISAENVYEFIDQYECDLVLITCTKKVKNGRQVVICKEVW